MSLAYSKHVAPCATPHTEPIPGKPMVVNSAGGFTFAVDDWTRLERFLILGADGGTYYASERKLTVENADAVIRCIKTDGVETVRRIREISVKGRAPKQDPAIFALALVGAHGNDAARHAAYQALPDACRIGTHLFSFVGACNDLRGNGSGLHRAIKNWYECKQPVAVAYQVTKYQSREKWSHRDVLRMVRPKWSGDLQTIAHWIVKGWDGVGEQPHDNPALLPIWAMERAKRAESREEIVRLVRDYRLVRECIPTKWLNEPTVWEALLEEMPLTALVRNLGKMTSIGLLAPLSKATARVVYTLSMEDVIRKARLHPLALLLALKTYAQGHGEKGSLKWSPVQAIVDALDAAFYLAFAAVEPTNKRWLLALDVSRSMDCGAIAGMPGITPRIGAAAMALVTAAVEKQHHIVGFTSNGWQSRSVPGRYAGMGYGTGVSPVAISPRQRLDAVVQTMKALPMGGTDCALPMLYAMENRIPVDLFCVYTDNETYAGGIHPCQALNQYRQKMGIGAKLAVCGMTSTGFSIADPADAGMMDVVGLDTATPAILADFARN